jgi:dTDP-4-amino-4,6-dideoxygalactose transaminase
VVLLTEIADMTSTADVHQAEPIPEAAAAEIKGLLESGDLFRYTATSGSPASQLEAEFADFMGAPFALAVNSCSSALFLSLKSLGLGAGEKVLIPAFTFAAVPSAIVHAGCRPVLVNVGENYRIDVEEFEDKLSSDIQAVMISHMRGHTSDMEAIMALCDSRQIPVIEDAAHSLGSTWSGRKIGTIGRIGCFSFQSYKQINAGEGGMLITHDSDVFARSVIMSGAYEHNWRKHAVVNGRFAIWQNRLPIYSMRMSNLSAAVVRPQLREVARRAKEGRANHDYVAAILNASDWLDVPPPLEQEGRAPDSIQFNLRGFDSDEAAMAFQQRANEMGVLVQVIGLSEDNARAFWNWDFIGPQNGLEQTRDILRRACDVRLPPRLNRAELDFIANTLVQAVEAVKNPAVAACTA